MFELNMDEKIKREVAAIIRKSVDDKIELLIGLRFESALKEKLAELLGEMIEKAEERGADNIARLIIETVFTNKAIALPNEFTK